MVLDNQFPRKPELLPQLRPHHSALLPLALLTGVGAAMGRLSPIIEDAYSFSAKLILILL